MTFRKAERSPRAVKLVEDIGALLPLVAENAARAEAERKPVDEVMAAIEATGIYNYFVPKRFGGWELDLDTYVDIGMMLGEACASTGWVVTFCMEHNWMVAQFPMAGQEEIFGERGYVIAPGAIAPNGKARADGDGYILDGRWQWGTGVTHADWALLGGIVEDTGELRMFAVPIADVEVIDTWDATGMTGTGSNDMQVSELKVPSSRAVLIPEMFIGRAEGGLAHGTPMFRMPMMPILCLAAGTPAIGAAKGALKAFCERAESRVMYASTERQADAPATHIRVGHARARIEAAEIIAREVAAETEQWGSEDDICGAEDRVKLRVRMAYAVRLCRDVVRDLFEVSGASAQLASQPIQRIHRDVHTIASHTVFDLDYIAEQYGRMALGLEPSRAV